MLNTLNVSTILHRCLFVNLCPFCASHNLQYIIIYQPCFLCFCRGTAVIWLNMPCEKPLLAIQIHEAQPAAMEKQPWTPGEEIRPGAEAMKIGDGHGPDPHGKSRINGAFDIGKSLINLINGPIMSEFPLPCLIPGGYSTFWPESHR